jgi:hypothetical protein
MDTALNPARRFGAIAALAAAAAATSYAIPQLLQITGVLTDPWDRIAIFAPSLALAPLFVFACVGVHATRPAPLKVWSLAGLALAIMYAVDVSFAYVTQLSVVVPADIAGAGGAYDFARCCDPPHALRAVDVLGYSWMSLSSLLLAPAFPGGGVRRALRWALIANGLVGIPIFLQLWWEALLWFAAPWLVTFPLAMILLAKVVGEERG